MTVVGASCLSWFAQCVWGRRQRESQWSDWLGRMRSVGDNRSERGPTHPRCDTSELGYRDESTDSCDGGAQGKSGEDVAGVMGADIHPTKAITTASRAATLPHRRLVNISPAATAPTTVAWSLGNEKSVVLSTSRWMPVIDS